MTQTPFKRILLAGGLLLAAGMANAQDTPQEIVLTIKNHTFTPKEVKIPAGKKVRLIVVNEDPTPAEFESNSLGREKIIPGKARAVVIVGPLKPGRYDFFEEFHQSLPSAHGVIVVE
ncbi:MAG: cupredoxin domain-containing protein [Rhodoferax sp.]|nr:cupredoxin domain-containing protein [Rhodoferax sp.]